MDPKGKSIKGDVVDRGYENQIRVYSMATAGQNDTQINFLMNVQGASAILKQAMLNGERLVAGEMTMTTMNVDRLPSVTGTIKMEAIEVLSCEESMGSDGTAVTHVTLQPLRIGWTYYQTSRTGLQTVTNKYGFNLETGGSWTKF